MHNEKDNAVQWPQGIELYMALRRLGKNVGWLHTIMEDMLLMAKMPSTIRCA